MTKTTLGCATLLAVTVSCASEPTDLTAALLAGDAGDAGSDASIATDAAIADAALPSDAGASDAGDASPDGEVGDAATEPDAGLPDAAAASDAGDGGPICVGPPGLYSDDHCAVLAPGVRPYTPQFPLWADGAEKDRFVYLPPGTQIDTSNPDRWTFPTGTVLYKTFSLNGLRIETRVLEKVGTRSGYANWNVDSYAWTEDQLSVTVAESTGVPNALGTTHDIPSTAQCRQCHNMTGLDPVNGFGAIQLNHGASPLTLATLLDENLLRNGNAGAALNVNLSNATLPGDEVARAGLGYLHANCGHCHGGPNPRAMQQLWSLVGMAQVTDTPMFQTAICRCLTGWLGRTTPEGASLTLRIAPGHAATSGVIARMSRRGRGEQMPPVGTSVIDPDGIAAVTALIDSLDATACDAAPPVCRMPMPRPTTPPPMMMMPPTTEPTPVSDAGEPLEPTPGDAGEPAAPTDAGEPLEPAPSDAGEPLDPTEVDASTVLADAGAPIGTTDAGEPTDPIDAADPSDASVPPDAETPLEPATPPVEPSPPMSLPPESMMSLPPAEPMSMMPPSVP